MKIIDRTYRDLAFDAAADPGMSELDRWTDLIVCVRTMILKRPFLTNAAFASP